MGKKAVSQDTKKKIITLKQETDMSNCEIAGRCKVHEKCVRNTWLNYLQFGTVADKKRSGRPPKTTQRENSLIYRDSRRNPTFSSSKLAARFKIDTGKTISRTTIDRILKNHEILSYRACRKPLLKPSHMIARRKWCKERLNWSTERWKRVIFSDEANFEVVNRKNVIFIKRRVNEKYVQRYCKPRVQGGGGSVGIWGCMSGSDTGVSNIYSGRLNAYLYEEILENGLVPSKDLLFSGDDDWIYQHDGAPCHTAGSIKSWIEEKKITTLPWPAKSPDLNPIENIWSWMDHQLSFIEIKNNDELIEAVERIWLQITKEQCATLIESMKRRVSLCYKNNGGHIPY